MFKIHLLGDLMFLLQYVSQILVFRKLLHFLELTLWGDQDLNVVVGASQKQNIRYQSFNLMFVLDIN